MIKVLTAKHPIAILKGPRFITLWFRSNCVQNSTTGIAHKYHKVPNHLIVFGEHSTLIGANTTSGRINISIVFEDAFARTHSNIHTIAILITAQHFTLLICTEIETNLFFLSSINYYLFHF